MEVAEDGGFRFLEEPTGDAAAEEGHDRVRILVQRAAELADRGLVVLALGLGARALDEVVHVCARHCLVRGDVDGPEEQAWLLVAAAGRQVAGEARGVEGRQGAVEAPSRRAPGRLLRPVVTGHGAEVVRPCWRHVQPEPDLALVDVRAVVAGRLHRLELELRPDGKVHARPLRRQPVVWELHGVRKVASRHVQLTRVLALHALQECSGHLVNFDADGTDRHGLLHRCLL